MLLCRASNDLGTATSAGKSSACTMKCYQAPVGSCGGPNANTIYTQNLAAGSGTTGGPTASLPPPSVPPVVDPPAVLIPPPVPVPPAVPAGQLSSLDITSLGCFADGAPRAMPAQLKVSPSMTIDECARLAYANQGRAGIACDCSTLGQYIFCSGVVCAH